MALTYSSSGSFAKLTLKKNKVKTKWRQYVKYRNGQTYGTVVALKKNFAVSKEAWVIRCQIGQSNTDAKKKALVSSCFDSNFRTYHKSSPISWVSASFEVQEEI